MEDSFNSLSEALEFFTSPSLSTKLVSTSKKFITLKKYFSFVNPVGKSKTSPFIQYWAGRLKLKPGKFEIKACV